MKTFRRIAKPLSYVLMFGMLSLNLYVPPVRAAMVGTESVLSAAQAQQDRARLSAALERDEVMAQLAAMGVDPAQAQGRVAGLTDQEVQTLNARLDQLPAGGTLAADILWTGFVVFLVLLFTDILGYTNIFPFVNHPRR